MVTFDLHSRYDGLLLYGQNWCNAAFVPDSFVLPTIQCAWQYLLAYFMAGLPLDYLVNDIESIVSVMIEYEYVPLWFYDLVGSTTFPTLAHCVSAHFLCSQKFETRKALPYHQFLLNLTGRSDNILDMNRGTAIDRMNSLGVQSIPDLADQKSELSLNL